jgi:glycerol dehydrogenase-like iron-containing ADH family enzyme
MPTPPNELDALQALRAYETAQAAAHEAEQQANQAHRELQEALNTYGLPITAATANIINRIINEIDTSIVNDDEAAKLLTLTANHFRSRWIKLD